MKDILNIPISLFIQLFLTAVVLFLFFWIMIKYVVPRIKKEKIQNYLSYYLPLFRNTIWILFFMSFIYKLALYDPYASLFVFGSLLAFTWQFVRDFIQGVIFGFQKGNIIGQSIKIEDYSGIVTELQITKLHLELENGEILQYPYSKITGQKLIKPTTTDHLKSCNFTVSVSSKVDIDDAKHKLKSFLLNMPWVVSSRKIKLEVFEQQNQITDIKVVVFTSHEKYIPKIKQEVADLIF